MTIWTVSYQTTDMSIFEWISWGRYVDHVAASNAAKDIFLMCPKEEIINVRIRKEQN